MGAAGRPPGDRRVAGPGSTPIVALTPFVRESPRSETASVRTLAPGEHGYPEALRDLKDPPLRLYVRGDAIPPLARTVAIVGTRTATPYGLRLASQLASDLAARGIAVVSGLARGVDAAAHEAALASGGRTLAVIPSALDRVTPAAHVTLAARIVRSGALLSEVGEGGPFGRGAFVRRNRIIAALAAATVVVEAGEASGALATAAIARTLGRAVLAVPGDVDRPGAQGTLSLLRQGARPCADAADVLASLPAPMEEPVTPESRLEAALDSRPRDVTALAEASGAGVADTLARLLRLQWSGIAVSHPGGRWSRRNG